VTDITTKQIHEFLTLEIPENDSGATTAHGYLLALLTAVWKEGESFDGKRPFGSSGWERELVQPMIAAGLVAGILDEDGYVATADYDAVDELVLAAINTLDAPYSLD
jgi:hypothetical protein